MEKRLRTRLNALEEKGLMRNLTPVTSCRNNSITAGDDVCFNLSSNDYLGLASDQELHHRFYQTLGSDSQLDYCGLGSASSRLLTGNRAVYSELENRLSCLYGKNALVFNSGYHANIGILPALSDKRDLILADKLCHASLIDGMRLARADVIRYRHLDFRQLAGLLEKKRDDYENVFIVTESVFSMDGDIADLQQLVLLKKRYNCWLYVDEAHAVGVFGDQGLGYAEQQGVLEDIDILVGTFGKALASVGAFIVCTELTRMMLINSMRSFIFTTALPPVNLAWSLFVLNRVVAMKEERKELIRLGSKIRRGISDRGFSTDGESQIVPVHIGNTSKILQMTAELRQRGLLLLPIRPPTVPAGTARFRLSLTAGMCWEDVKDLPDLLRDLYDNEG